MKKDDFLKDNEPVKDSLEIRERELKKQLADMAEKAQSSVDEVLLEMEDKLQETSNELKEKYEERMREVHKKQEMRRREREEIEKSSLEELYYRIFKIGIILAIVMSTIACVGTYVYDKANHDVIIERQISLEKSTKNLVLAMRLPIDKYSSSYSNFYQEVEADFSPNLVNDKTLKVRVQDIKSYLASHGWKEERASKGESDVYLAMVKDDREIIISSHSEKENKQYYLRQIYTKFPDVPVPYNIMHYMYTSPLEKESSFLYGLMTMGIIAALGSLLAAKITLTKEGFNTRYAIKKNRYLYMATIIAIIINGGLYLLLLS